MSELRDAVVREFHRAYEEAAVREGWSTQTSTRVEYDDLPEANRRTMEATVDAVLAMPEIQRLLVLRALIPEVIEQLETFNRKLNDGTAVRVPDLMDFEAAIAKLREASQ